MSSNKEENLVYTYQWHYDDKTEERSTIHMFGLDCENKSVYVKINGFTPYVYMEIPEDIDWYNEYNNKNLFSKIDEICGKFGFKNRPVSKSIQYKKKLYYANKKIKNGELVDKKYPFVCLVFKVKKHIMFSKKELDKGFYINIRKTNVEKTFIKTKIHESNSNPVLQLTCYQDIKPSGWVTIQSNPILEEEEKESGCDVEYNISWKQLKVSKSDIDRIPNPLVMAFDIEVNSKNVNAMPNFKFPEDKVFQVSCIFFRQGVKDVEKYSEKYLLTLGFPDQKMVGEGVKILNYKTESQLLEGYADLICEKNPNIVVGYNIFQFDIPYMIERSKFNFCTNKFNQQTFLLGKEGTYKTISWSSSAYKNQNFTFLDCEGRLFIDLLPIVKRDYNFDTYSLKNVSTIFLGQTKDPLSPKGIFKCYRLFTPQSLGVVGKYVIQDSMLVVRLFEKLQVWVGLNEMSKICNTPMLSLFTQGQQVKIFSQIYKICMDSNYVVEQDGYVCNENDNYTGAYVFDPTPGLYDMAVSFDFSSLYPSVVIAYNIDYTTLVLDSKIPDDMCHIFEWEDHIGCEHDTKKRKTKPKSVICAAHKFRFLREPKGIIPTLLEKLLDSRKKINAEIKLLKSQLENIKDEDTRDEIETRITVLDKRQLATKISANSMYGGFGVKKGYLPFMPGAMCTTARGRESIEKAARHIQNNYGAKLIYGDSVSGDTPILVKYEDESVDIVRIDEMGEVWENYDGFKSQDSNRKEKEQTIPFISSGCFRVMNIVKVWTGEEWSMVNRVIRHKTEKKMYRVLTHTGCVDVTEDHSLLDENRNKINPTEISINNTKLYQSFPSSEDFPEIEIEDSKIEGKVLECQKCKEYKLLFEFEGEGDNCRLCEGKTDVNLTEYLRNPSQKLDGSLSKVWGIFMRYGNCIDHNWAVKLKEKEIIEFCKRVLTEVEDNFKWSIIYENGTYILSPKGNNLDILKRKWKYLFYDRFKNKKIPYFVLNGSDEVKHNFILGYSGTIDNILAYGKASAQGFYVLYKSLGYNVKIKYNKEGEYVLDIYDKPLDNFVKNIINLPTTTQDEYVYDIETETGRFMGGIGNIILKNTDSCYINFPQFKDEKDAQDCYDFCINVENEMLSLFPRPMKLAYEDKIYWRFFILSKKRYMALQCDSKGKISDKIFKRGVVLTRRDNSKLLKKIYSELIMKIFRKDEKEEVLEYVRKSMTAMFEFTYKSEDFVITKSIGDIEDYKIRDLPEDEKKRAKRLKELNCEEKDYKTKSLPSHIQLAEKMKTRGKKVEPGTRLEHVIIDNFDINARLFDKLESWDYFKENSSILRLDFYYYLKNFINPLDQVLETAYGCKDYLKSIYKSHVLKYNMLEELKRLSESRIKFV